MHPDLHTDLDNLDSVENNLRHSAKGSNDAYDVTFSLTKDDIFVVARSDCHVQIVRSSRVWGEKRIKPFSWS